jgi:hypothetical protein
MKENNIQILNMMDLFDSVEENNFLVDLNFDETLIKSWDCIKGVKITQEEHFLFQHSTSFSIFK